MWWVLWIVVVAGPALWHVPLERYDTEAECRKALEVVQRGLHEAYPEDGETRLECRPWGRHRPA